MFSYHKNLVLPMHVLLYFNYKDDKDRHSKRLPGSSKKIIQDAPLKGSPGVNASQLSPSQSFSLLRSCLRGFTPYMKIVYCSYAPTLKAGPHTRSSPLIPPVSQTLAPKFLPSALQADIKKFRPQTT